MSCQKPTDLAKMREHYGLALEEIKLERSINSLTSNVSTIGDPTHNEYLQNRIDQQKRQLRSLRKLRAGH